MYTGRSKKRYQPGDSNCAFHFRCSAKVRFEPGQDQQRVLCIPPVSLHLQEDYVASADMKRITLRKAVEQNMKLTPALLVSAKQV